MNLLQALAGLACQVFERQLIAVLQHIHRQVHQHAIERPGAAPAQQAQKRLPAQAVHRGVGLAQIATGRVDQHRLFGEVPVRVQGAGDLAGQALLRALIERELQPGEIQQAGLAAALRADQQVPGQLLAPLFTAAGIQARALEGTQRLAVAMPQLGLFFADQALLTQGLLGLLGALLAALELFAAPVGKHQGQPPQQHQQADAGQTAERRGPEALLGNRQQRADEPDQQARQQHQQQAPDPGPRQETADPGRVLLDVHVTSSLTAWKTPVPRSCPGTAAGRGRAVRPAPRRSPHTARPGRPRYTAPPSRPAR